MRHSHFAILVLCSSLYAGEPFSFRETFDAPFDAKRFTTPIPNKNTTVHEGVLVTKGESGGKYPPMVYLPVAGADLEITFRYRHTGEGGWLWFFVDGDDGFGSVDHLLRVKLLRNAVQLQVDGHTKDPDHPLRQKTGREADPVSGAWRTNEILPAKPLDLSGTSWHEVKLVFSGEEVRVNVNGESWTETISRPGFREAKRKLLWMQNGGKDSIEIDEIRVEERTTSR
ncbi:MAG: hypothetical protein KDN18_21990 [Verrucomicrobiae bacterium]|nr:hypothetical protein [Verrucomicrobiae bacterium]